MSQPDKERVPSSILNRLVVFLKLPLVPHRFAQFAILYQKVGRNFIEISFSDRGQDRRCENLAMDWCVSTELNGNNTYSYEYLFETEEEGKARETRPRLQTRHWHVQVVVESYNNVT